VVAHVAVVTLDGDGVGLADDVALGRQDFGEGTLYQVAFR